MSTQELRAILIRIATDDAFLAELNELPWVAWEGYNLTPGEKRALISGDVDWVERQVGKLDERLRMRLKWPPDAMATLT